MEPGWILSAPAWSRDGEKIAFAATHGGVAGTTTGIWTMNADGSNKEMLTNTLAGFDGQPSWSPDGTRIVFVRWYSGDADLAFVSSTGGPVSRLPLAGDQFSPAWSPDGRHIAFAQQKDGYRPLIYTVKPDGSDVRLRTSLISGGGSEPAWITR
jgi:TolB protein